MKQKKPPVRHCLGCNEAKEKKEMIRIVKMPDNQILLDKTGKGQGRGAYICPTVQCLTKAIKTKKLNRAFSCQIPDELILQLEGEMEKI